jgi:hypothetical protein
MKGARRLRDLHFRATPAQVAQLEAHALARSAPIADILREALATYLAQTPPPSTITTGLTLVWPDEKETA